MREEIFDRIAADIRERGEPLPAQDIARDYLRLVQAGPAALKLVAAMLGRDARFVQSAPGLWGLAARGPRLDPPVVLWTCESPAGAQKSPWLWRAWTTLWGGDEAVRVHQGAQATAELEAMLADIAAYPVAAERPGLLQRWLGTQERLHAFPECDPVVIDLRGWAKLLNGQTSGADETAAGDQPSATGRETLAAQAAALERIAAAARAHGLRTWREVALAPRAAAPDAGEPRWAEHWAFTREQIAALPEEPGVYRFLDREGRLLYVGKSKNLRSRVGSYFRPLDAGSARRTAFLAQMSRLETETTGTELDALLSEAEQIRTRQPVWNVQLGFTGGDESFTASTQDLILLLPRADGALGLFALGGARVARTRIDAACDLDSLREALRIFFVEGTAAQGLDEVTAPERVLVRRWLRWQREGHTVLRLSDFATFAGVVEAIGHALRDAPECGLHGPGNGNQVVREGVAPESPERA